MFSGQSLLGVAAASIYAMVVLVCLCAAAMARSRQQVSAHVATWLILGCFFAILIVLRAYDVEETLREAMREAMRAEGKYNRRRDVQRMYASGAIILAAMVLFGLVYRTMHRPKGRRDVAVLVAKIAGLVMAVVITARMISLSPVDKLLYGPLKLNWLGDVGSSLVVIAAALTYLWLLVPRRG